MFHIVVLDPRLLRVREDLLPIDDALPHVHHGVIGTRPGAHVLHVHLGEPAGILREVGEGVLPPIGDPEQVHLALEQLGVRVGEQDVVRQLPLERFELVAVIVIGQLQSRGLDLLAGLVERLGHALPAVDVRAQLLVDPGERDVREAHGVRVCDHRIQAGRQLRIVEVHRHGRKSQAVQQRFHLRGRAAEEVRELDFLVADRGDLLQRAFEVGFEKISHRIELEADFRDTGNGKRETGNVAQRGTHGCQAGSGRPKEFPSSHVSRFTIPVSRLHGHISFLFIASTAKFAARAVSAM